MADFKLIEETVSHHPVISAPRRGTRPDATAGTLPLCPFCPGNDDTELYRILGRFPSEWLVRVIPNKFPFTQFHELIIHAPDHHKNFDELPELHVHAILQTYRQRYNTHKEHGQVVIFHNRGQLAGESVPHAHTQLTVIPFATPIDTPVFVEDMLTEEHLETSFFHILCPSTSPWPDEIWVAPKESRRYFGESTDEELSDLSQILPQLIRIHDMRHGNEFPFNFYIYPGKDWYLRIIPRSKTLGGFEVSTGIFVNTQDPKETMTFIKQHFEQPDKDMIRAKHSAQYRRGV